MDLTAIRAFFTSLTLEKLTPTILILVIGLFLIKGLTKLFDRVLARSKIEKSIHPFLRATFRGVLYVLLILVAAGSLGIDVTSLVALFSVVSLAVSLAVQGALSNVCGGVMILSTHPFRVGDWVEIAGVAGTVHEIGMSYTRLLTADRKEIFVPNSEISSSKIVNYTAAGVRRVEFQVTASYQDAAETVKAALLRAAELPAVHADPAPFAAVSQYGEHAVEYVLHVWTASEDYWNVYYAVMERIRSCFHEDGVAMTYPHLNVHLES